MIALLDFSTYSIAQTYTETVYLKNGSMIKGVVIEQVPNTSLKIKTSDGSIFVYNMSEVEKITKEEVGSSTYQNKRSDKPSLRGYKGFVDAGYHVDISDYNADKMEAYTSHGYQFNNFIFLGAGVGVSHYPDLEATAIPVFTNFRVNFTKKKTTPFADLKVGYSAGDIEGTYAAAIGVRFGLKNKKVLNLRLELSYQQAGGMGYRWSETFEYNSAGVKFGFEF